QEQRVVDCRRRFAGCFPGPSSDIAAKTPRAALDFDQKTALGSEDEQVDFVDAAIVGNEFKVSPCAIGLVRGGLLANELQSFPFPRKARLRHSDPVGYLSHRWQFAPIGQLVFCPSTITGRLSPGHPATTP